MQMSSSLAAADFSRGRRANESSKEPIFSQAARNLIAKVRSWLGSVVSFVRARIWLIFVIGFAAGLAWQWYSGPVRQAIAGWSPRLAWMAPATVTAGPSAERLRATSQALAAARQSIDRLNAEISKLQSQQSQQAASDKRSRRASQRL
jgi:hypothetical protein